eukprot:scaffold145_cov54-Attheya_sp.AAC.5
MAEVYSRGFLAIALSAGIALMMLEPSSAFVPVPTFGVSSSSSSLLSTAEPLTSGPTTLDGETIRGPIAPLGNFVLVRTKDMLSSTEGGILLPDQAQERPTEGEVMAAGPGKIHPDTGILIDNPVIKGMNVLYGKYDGVGMVYNDEDVQMIRDDDVLLYYTGIRMTLENVTPCRDYVLVEIPKTKLEMSSGVVIASSVTKDDLPCEGAVILVGEGRMCSKGVFTPAPCAVGDRVKFRDYAGNPVKIQNKEYSLVRMIDLLCSIPQENKD